jgi:hypothetical protein
MNKTPSPLEGLISHVLDADEINVLVATSKNREDPIELHRLQLTDELTEEFRDAALEVLTEPDDVILVPYEASYTPSPPELLFLDQSRAPDVNDLVEAAFDISVYDDFHPEDSLIRNLRFYVIVVSTADENAGFFREFTRSKELTSRSKRFAAMFDGEVFKKVTEKTFLFDENADCYSWRENLFIRRKAGFERIFRYLEELREAADATLDQVLQHVPVSNEDEFREACKGQIQMLAKLASISRKPYLAELTVEVIQETIETFDLQVDLVKEEGETKLVFDPSNQESRWAILKLLDDDYLQSVMTEEKYEATSKIAVT